MVRLEELKGLKKKDLDAPWIRKVLRYIATPIAIALSKTRITPNQVSFVYFMLYIVSAFLYSKGDYFNNLVASVLLFIGIILDRVDGSLARIKKIESDYGYWFDKTFDNLGRTAIFLGLTFGVYKQTGNYLMWPLGLLGITNYLLISIQHQDFMNMFKFGKEVVNEERKKRKILKQLFYNEPLIPLMIVLFSIFDRLNWFIVLSGTYGTLCMIIQYAMLTLKIKKGIKNAPQATQDERYDSRN